MDKIASNRQVALLVLLAIVFWVLAFGVKLMNFWLSMSIATITLSLLSIYFAGLSLKRSEINWRNIALGVISAAILYGIFALGNYVSQIVFSFAKPEVSAIYGIRNQGQAVIIALVLLFITSPGEEFFWRGFLQKWAMNLFGGTKGWLVSASLYGGVHIISGNLMLTLAALIAGLFWGFLYWRSGSIFACIISHALWTVSIFVLWPIL